MKKILLTLLLFAFSGSTLMAQLVTPSLDPTQEVILPTASSWRYTTAIGGMYANGEGTQTLDGADLTTTKMVDSAYAIAINLDWFSLEGSSLQKLTTYKDLTGDEQTQAYIKTVGHLAFKWNEMIAVGGFQRTITEGKRLESDSISDYQDLNRVGTGGSLSLQLFEMLFLSGGTENYKETEDVAVGNVWTIQHYGVALRTGMPSGFQTRFEYSNSQSSANVQDASGTIVANIHPKTVETRTAAELSYKGLLFSYFLYNKTETEDGVTNGEERTAQSTQLGLVWIPQEGTSLGFYSITDSSNRKYYSGSTQVEEKSALSVFQINLAYLF